MKNPMRLKRAVAIGGGEHVINLTALLKPSLVEKEVG